MKVILSVPDEGYSEHTWWRLFLAYLMKVILNVPDEGYSERTWWRLFWVYLMKVILSIPDEGYSERTRWRLFQKRVMCTKLDIYVFININFQVSFPLSASCAYLIYTAQLSKALFEWNVRYSKETRSNF